jgi:predicted MFS family arabinose efflux permease
MSKPGSLVPGAMEHSDYDDAVSLLPAVGTVALGTFFMVTIEFPPTGLLSSIAHDFQISEGPAGRTVTVPGIVVA